MKRILAFTICVFGMASMANAAIVTYIGSDVDANSTDPRPNSIAAAAAFDAAAASIGSVTLIDFESAPLGVFNNLALGSGITMDGSDVSTNDQTIRNTPFGTPDRLFGYNTTAGGSQFVSLFGGSLTFSFAPGIHAFGGYFSGNQVAGLNITFFDGAPQTILFPFIPSGVMFVGFTDAGQNIASVQVNVLNDIVGVDDVRVGRQEIPEPASIVLLGMGGLGLLAARRRRQAV